MQIHINGTNLYYDVVGQGQPLVMIAGLAGHSGTWPNQIPPFSKQYQVIVIDNRNSGRSDIDDQYYSIKTMADDVIALLDHLNIRSAHILGRSMGGYIAQEIAINNPSYVDKLVLSVTTPITSNRNNALFSHLLKLKAIETDPYLFWEAFAFWQSPPAFFDREAQLKTTIEDCLADPYAQSYAGFNNQIRAIAEHNTLDRLHHIKAQTLVIAAEQDILILPREGKVLADRIDNTQWHCLPAAAHLVHNDQASLFNDTILQFLAQ